MEIKTMVQAVAITGLLLAGAGCAGGPLMLAPPTPTSTPTSTPTATPAPTSMPTLPPTPTTTPSPAPTATPRPTSTAIPVPTVAPVSTATSQPTPAAGASGEWICECCACAAEFKAGCWEGPDGTREWIYPSDGTFEPPGYREGFCLPIGCCYDDPPCDPCADCQALCER